MIDLIKFGTSIDIVKKLLSGNSGCEIAFQGYTSRPFIKWCGKELRFKNGR